VNIRALATSVRTRWPLYAGLVLALILAAAAVAFFASRRVDAPVSTSQSAAPADRAPAEASDRKTDRPDPEWERLSKVFEAATGHAEPYRVDRDDGSTWVGPVRIVKLPFGNVLLTEEEIEDGCHVCAGALGIYYFKEESGKIVVTGRWPRAVKGWGWGKPPSWQLTNRFTALPAIWEAGHDMHMGIDAKGATLTELRPGGPAKSDPIDTGLEDEGAPDPNGRGACMVRGEIVNVRPDVGFDVRVTGDVTALDQYRKKDGRFVAVSKINWQDPCPRRGPPPPDIVP
jgi:hypothetical protein